MKQQVRLKLWQPLGMLFGISREYFESGKFEDEMTDRLQDIPVESLITPNLSVAGPAVQGISFTVDEPALREMYLNLLAAASDDRATGDAHPAFAEIIRQLSTDEVEVLAALLPHPTNAVAEVRLLVGVSSEPETSGYTLLATHLLPLVRDGTVLHDNRLATYVDNWQRLGLMRVSYDLSYTDIQRYAWVDDHPEVFRLRGHHGRDAVNIQHGLLSVTDFGKLFWRVVVQPTANPSVDTRADLD